MKIADKIEGITRDKKLTAVMILGCGGLLLILLSSLLPEGSSKSETAQPAFESSSYSIEDYCGETERRLEGFLSSIDGAGRVRVYLTVGTQEQYVFAKEKKASRSENKNEEDESYVIIGKGNEKNALIETVKTPEITGAVVACSGCGDPVVTERIYKAVSAALGIPSAKIFVTKLNGS